MLSPVPLVSILFGLTYLALAIGKVPRLRLDRAAIALVGAAAMLAFGVLDLRDAAKAVDYQTIALLFGMMVLVAYLRMAGFFTLATDHVAARCTGPYSLLAVVIGLTGMLSAFLVNDVVCVALTPLVLSLCQRLRRPPVPYLVGLATASNIGSVATITGNPQNNIIGSLSGISYIRFATRLAPVALIGLVINFVVVAVIIFAAAAVLFHFANAAMLPLVGEKLTLGMSRGASALMSACIIAAQAVMVPVAVLASRFAESWGRKPVFLIGLAVLPVRGLLYTLTINP
jgi:Na+/H+ antiporter NhaD/arsenite permease-like protein